MDEPRRADTARSPGRAGPAWSPSWSLLAIAVGMVAGALAWWASSAEPAGAPVAATAAAPLVVSAAPPAAETAPAPAAVPAPLAAAPAAPPAPRTTEAGGDPTPDLSDYLNPGEKPTMNEVIGRLHQAGVHSGLGAFSPPGTRPPLVGIAVPEDFALPEGYVRHYQATDDGQRIEPILMFAPGRPVVDASGRPVAMPKDRVVPPELAPPGLPLRRITIPPPQDPGRPGS